MTPKYSDNMLGKASATNVLTLKFFPGTVFSVYGGRIVLSGPEWNN